MGGSVPARSLPAGLNAQIDELGAMPDGYRSLLSRPLASGLGTHLEIMEVNFNSLQI